MSNHNKKKLSEKIKDWNKEKLGPWIKDKFNELKNHKLKSTGSHYNFNQIKDVNYKTGSRLNVNIYNIGAINVGTKNINIKKMGDQPQLDRLKEIPSMNTYHTDNVFDSIFSRFEFIKDLYNIRDLKNVFSESIILLKDLMNNIALIYKFNFKNLEDLLNTISNLHLGKIFLLYDELFDINNAQKANLTTKGYITANLIEIFYGKIESIINKLKNDWNDSVLENFHVLKEN